MNHEPETGNVKFNRRRVNGKERTMILAITTTSCSGVSSFATQLLVNKTIFQNVTN